MKCHWGVTMGIAVGAGGACLGFFGVLALSASAAPGSPGAGNAIRFDQWDFTLSYF